MGYRKPETYGEGEWRDAGNQVQAMIRQDWRVWAVCQSPGCKMEVTVPLLAIAGVKGGSFSLFGQTIPCRRLGCRGRMVFYGQPPQYRGVIALTPPPGKYSRQVMRATDPSPADRLPPWAQTAGSLYAMVRRGGHCNFRCQICTARGSVDLVTVICHHGLGFSLIDRVGRCNQLSDCRGAVHFTAGPEFGKMIRLRTGTLPREWDRTLPRAMVCDVRYS